jgi:uncharacterized protein YaaR (DUF327 family)
MKSEQGADIIRYKRRVKLRGKQKLGRPRTKKGRKDYLYNNWQSSFESILMRELDDLVKQLGERDLLNDRTLGRGILIAVATCREAFLSFAYKKIYQEESLSKKMDVFLNIQKDVEKLPSEPKYAITREWINQKLMDFPNDLLRKSRQKLNKSKFSKTQVVKVHRIAKENPERLYLREAAKKIGITLSEFPEFLKYCRKMKRPIQTGKDKQGEFILT